MTSDAPAALVGPVLLRGPTTEALLTVLRAHNPALVVRRRGSYLRAQAPERCVLPLAAVAEALGAPFRAPADLGAVMTAFAGRMHVGADAVEWSDDDG